FPSTRIWHSVICLVRVRASRAANDLITAVFATWRSVCIFGFVKFLSLICSTESAAGGITRAVGFVCLVPYDRSGSKSKNRATYRTYKFTYGGGTNWNRGGLCNQDLVAFVVRFVQADLIRTKPISHFCDVPGVDFGGIAAADADGDVAQTEPKEAAAFT